MQASFDSALLFDMGFVSDSGIRIVLSNNSIASLGASNNCLVPPTDLSLSSVAPRQGYKIRVTTRSVFSISQRSHSIPTAICIRRGLASSCQSQDVSLHNISPGVLAPRLRALAAHRASPNSILPWPLVDSQTLYTKCKGPHCSLELRADSVQGREGYLVFGALLTRVGDPFEAWGASADVKQEQIDDLKHQSKEYERQQTIRMSSRGSGNGDSDPDINEPIIFSQGRRSPGYSSYRPYR